MSGRTGVKSRKVSWVDGGDAMPEGEANVSTESRSNAARWPRVLGVVGGILGVLMFLDKLDDLFVTKVLPMQELSGLIGAEATELIVTTSSAGWGLASFLVAGSLGILLLVGSVRLSHRNPSGVTFCAAWAWMAMGWALVETIRAAVVLRTLAASTPVISGVDWTAFAGMGIAAALIVMLAYPVFLLIWFSRPSVRAEYSAWTA